MGLNKYIFGVTWKEYKEAYFDKTGCLFAIGIILGGWILWEMYGFKFIIVLAILIILLG